METRYSSDLNFKQQGAIKMNNNKTSTDKTNLTNPLKKAVEINKGAKLFATASFLLLLGVLLFIGKSVALAVNQETLAVNQENLSINQETQVVKQEAQAQAVNKEVQAVNQEVQSVNQETLAVNKEAQAVNKETQAVNKEVQNINQETPAVHQEDLSIKQAQALQAVHQDIQDLIKKQFKSTFKDISFTNLEPAPINFWYQAEINHEVVYFSPTQALMFLGEVYNNNGVSLSEQTRKRWQAKKVANLDLSAALVIGSGAIEIIEFTDTDCLFCQRFNQWISAKNKAYKNKHNKDLVTRKIVLIPIDLLHPKAHKEAVHVLCQAPKDYVTTLKQTLEETIAFSDLDACKKGRDLLIKHRKIAQALGVSATPTLVIDGQIIQGFNLQKLEGVIKQQLNKKVQ